MPPHPFFLLLFNEHMCLCVFDWYMCKLAHIRAKVRYAATKAWDSSKWRAFEILFLQPCSSYIYVFFSVLSARVYSWLAQSAFVLLINNWYQFTHSRRELKKKCVGLCLCSVRSFVRSVFFACSIDWAKTKIAFRWIIMELDTYIVSRVICECPFGWRTGTVES